MKFVQDYEVQGAGVLNDFGVNALLAGQEQFSHHEVGQQNVGKVVSDLLAFLPTFLTSIATYDRPKLFRQTGLGNEFFDLFDLAISERVHRIDDYGARTVPPAGFPLPHDRVDDWHEEAQRLSRSGPGCHHVALTGSSFCYRL